VVRGVRNARVDNRRRRPMKRESSSQRLSETIQHLSEHWQHEAQEASGRPTAKRRTLAIALSREAGAQGSEIGRAVGARLGWSVYDQELLDHIAADLGVRTGLLKSVDERQKPWLEEAFESLLGTPFVNESTFVHRLVKTVLAIGAKGECVIIGRGAS